MRYKHIFFDLDHTLWDFDKNAEETLQELYKTYELDELGVSCADTFIATYTKNNHELWTSYHEGKISKDQLRQTRFKKTFLDLGVPPEIIPALFEDDYVRICPTKTNLFPHVHETLSYLEERYSLHLISNGFLESTQMKVDLCGLERYFKTVVISENVGFNKPDRAIFDFALKGAGAQKEESLMVGDSLEADIRGALSYGMSAIYFNPGDKPKPEDVEVQVTQLYELMNLL